MIKDYIRLIRWSNLMFIAILMWVMEKWVAVPVLNHIGFSEQLPWWLLLMLTLSTVLIAAGGYVINDYFDVKIDRINRPDRVIVAETVSKESAMLYFQILTGCGLALGVWSAAAVHSWTLGLIFVMVPGLLWFYSSSYKRLFLIGNLIISLAAGLTPLTIAIANIGYMNRLYGSIMQWMPVAHDLYLWLGGFALFAFLCTWIRETIKDLQDQMGDRELECHTMPIVIGETWTKVFITVLTLATMALIAVAHWCWLPFPTIWHSLATRFVVFGLLVPFACDLWLLWAAKIPSDYKTAQNVMKFIMFIGTMFSFVVLKLL
ncbi:MAG: geranylgeranylglycerol-phosphate geranylgeranyltransferase [Paludibacteraceae bacterium]|nr:geranylgeranylglycerol-phosphate geranylgeranyltransferase [Paludibacteraceae bacterium]